jgi:hypothetical protein
MATEFHYCYLLTNTVTGQQYVGDRSCNCEISDDKYLGSGVDLGKAKKYYTCKVFKKQILEDFSTRLQAFIAQEKYIKFYKTHISQGGYNISWTGGTYSGGHHSDETKLKIKQSNKGKHSGEKCYFKGNPFKKGKSYEQQMIELYGEKEGIEKAIEYKKKISDTSKGKNNGMYKRGFLIQGKNNGMFGIPSPMKNVKRSEESKQKMGESKKGIKRKLHLCCHCNKEIPDGNYERWHGENCKQNKIK